MATLLLPIYKENFVMRRSYCNTDLRGIFTVIHNVRQRFITTAFFVKFRYVFAERTKFTVREIRCYIQRILMLYGVAVFWLYTNVSGELTASIFVSEFWRVMNVREPFFFWSGQEHWPMAGDGDESSCMGGS
jgi:hypothetical protein